MSRETLKKIRKSAPRRGKVSPAVTPVPLRVPKHGKGKLRSGGSNGGAGGRPPSEIRARLRGSFDQRIAVIERIVDELKGSPADRTRALELMAKYGLGTETTVNLNGFPDAQRAFYLIEQVIRANTSQQVGDSLINQITETLRTM